MYRVYVTLIEMLKDRGFNTGYLMTREEFNNCENRDKQFEKDDDKIDIYWMLDIKIGTSAINNVYGKMTENKVTHCILIISGGITPPAKNVLSKLLTGQEHNIEIFHISDLMFNVTKHKWVPRHIPLSNDEKKKIVNEYGIKETRFPKIQLSDPVSRYFGLKRGTLVKIIRPRETTTSYVSYRIVSL